MKFYISCKGSENQRIFVSFQILPLENTPQEILVWRLLPVVRHIRRQILQKTLSTEGQGPYRLFHWNYFSVQLYLQIGLEKTFQYFQKQLLSMVGFKSIRSTFISELTIHPSPSQANRKFLVIEDYMSYWHEVYSTIDSRYYCYASRITKKVIMAWRGPTVDKNFLWGIFTK